MVGFFKNTRTAQHIGAVLTIRTRSFGSFIAVSSRRFGVIMGTVAGATTVGERLLDRKEKG
jgi:hypothetical protein